MNERIAHLRSGAGSALLICECDDPACTHRVDVPLEEYEDVRAEPRRFLVWPGHADTSIERVIEKRRGFDVVEKTEPDAVEIAEETDPR